MGYTWARALGWRLRRQLLDPVSVGTVADVVERLGAVPAWPDASAELAIGARRTDGRSGDVAHALAAGKLINIFAFRGATHLMTPAHAGDYLAVRASSRMWELPSWQSFYGLTPDDWPPFREFVRHALAERPLTRAELIAALDGSGRYRHLSTILSDGNDTLLKPLTWQGDMALGPVRGREATYLRLADVPDWKGVPVLDDAGPRVVASYLRTYGPATADRVHAWFGEGLGAKRRDITRWLDQLDGQLEQISIEGDRVLAFRNDLEDLRTTTASDAVRFLPGRDPWVMASGTSDVRIVPANHRGVVGRTANLVMWRARVAGTWTIRGQRLEVAWFTEAGRVPRTALDGEVTVLAKFLDRPLNLITRIV